MSAPLTHLYNLSRLANGGDEVRFEAGASELGAIAAFAGALALCRFAVTVTLTKASSSRFRLAYRLEAEVTQTCVVTLEPVPARIDRMFARELHFAGTGRKKAPSVVAELDLSGQDFSKEDADEPEEIVSLHFDLAAPALEEFVLALDPYPRSAQAGLGAQTQTDFRPESPFAVLKGLKSGE